MRLSPIDTVWRELDRLCHQSRDLQRGQADLEARVMRLEALRQTAATVLWWISATLLLTANLPDWVFQTLVDLARIAAP